MPDISLRALVDDLGSPDPDVRDAGAYAALARLVRGGALGPADRTWLASAMLERLGHERSEARSFAPLVLGALVAAGDFGTTWVPAVTRWYVGEEDLRGHDPEVGWVHAVAHGADFIGACGAAGVGDPDALLDALARRLVAPTVHVWRDQEDDRVARAVCLVLARPGLSTATATGWLAHVHDLFASGSPGPVPAEASNTMHTLRSLHVALGQEVVHDEQAVGIKHAALVRARVTDLLAEVTPWFWRPQPLTRMGTAM
ncbi:hypothetical protein N865_03660 [Intrasporangium oryzae NRRL B-24470]|uniref:DUF2785 domain-containing protein n=1 Tax=Intrasporangium oryzae NRRL B-24470 TaxID=1386089 RepID=W9GGQ0_9MICO|nr:DUF2785 domain-containing protein [Intrasporangium oryzae]EWT03019.1 hypothetical protein N865_03660 [Intrasporangium oryzae NRRL B-24470]